MSDSSSEKSSIHFNGRFESKLDQKGRLALPKLLHEILPHPNNQVVITNSQYKGHRNLDVYTLEEWQKLEARIARLSPLKAEVQDFRRFYLASGQTIDPDKSRRILIPGPLRKYAGIETEAVLVGMGGKFEIWSAETWNKLYDTLASNFEDTLSAVAALDEES